MVWSYACVFFQNPEINFYYFLHILNIDIFWANNTEAYRQ